MNSKRSLINPNRKSLKINQNGTFCYPLPIYDSLNGTFSELFRVSKLDWGSHWPRHKPQRQWGASRGRTRY